MRTKRILIAILAFAVTAAALYIYFERDMIRLKTGRQLPIIWADPYGSDEQPIQLTESNQTLSEPKVHLTSLYYLPKSKEIHFGIWYNKWRYRSENIPFRVFQVSVKDKDGNSSELERFALKSGLLDEFHYRMVPMDLDEHSSIEMTIMVVEQQDDSVIPLETATLTIPIAPETLD